MIPLPSGSPVPARPAVASPLRIRKNAALLMAVLLLALGACGGGNDGALPADGQMVPLATEAATTQDLPQPLATNPLPTRAEVVRAMRRVNENWIVNHAAPGDRGWARATYYEGDMAMHAAYPDPLYLGYALKWATTNNWSLYQGVTTRHADNQCAGQTYVDLYRLDPQPVRIAMIEANLDNMLATSVVNDWWWVDALQMAMPVFARFAVLRNDSAYSERMYRMYDWTKRGEGGGLYDAARGLWWRDASFIPQRAPNGQPVFWARGNGWAFAAHARTLEELDKRATPDPHRAEYVQTFQQMAAAIAALQQPSGFWAPNMLDATSPPGPETSGTAFFTYGLAWGINHGLLDAGTYLPVVDKGWRAMVNVAIDATGRLGYIQPVGVGPAATATAADNHDFGVGAFLLAGSEVLKLAPGATPATVSSSNAALGRPVTASSQQAGNEAPGAVDNDLTTRWSAEVYPQWLRVDLGSVKAVRGVEVVALAQRAYRFRVEVSSNDSTWTTAVDATSNSETAAFLERPFAAPVDARYVRLTVTGVAGNITPWTSIVEFRVLQ
jgi:unsaturated rhamnogalacturonyl hydrolase